jgi:pantothenate synthetase
VPSSPILWAGHGHIVKRKNESEYKIIVQTFLNCSNFYSSPTLSSNLGTFIVDTTLLSDEFVMCYRCKI